MELTEAIKTMLKAATEVLHGYERRQYMAKIVQVLGKGGQSRAEQELGWNRSTIRKGMAELQGGFCYWDRFHERGRKRAEEHLPGLLEDIRSLVDEQSQTDPTFQSTRLYTRLSAAEVRKQLNQQKGYTAEALPCADTIRRKLNGLNYRLKPVQKSQPLHKIPETDAIFKQLQQVHEEARADESVLRLSLDAKAPVLLGDFSRQGVSRMVVKAWDHDFQGDSQKITPFGIYLPDYGELYLYFTASKLTSDFIVDCLVDFWQSQRPRFAHITTLLINQDNGPENHSRRTQFMQRLVELADRFQITLQLAYYPPYHSKYNPVERVWGGLEKHWNGSLLNSLATVLNFARSFTYKAKQPIVQLVEKVYATGVKLSQAQMTHLERRFQRLPDLGKWFVRIPPILLADSG
jgi:hypothetical protein